MKRFVFIAMVLAVAACQKKQETAVVPPSPAAPQTTTQMPQPPVTAVPAPPASTSEPAPPTTQPQSSGSSGSMGTSASSGAEEYTVAAGDTLSAIAREHNLNSRDIANWNNLKDPNRIHKGQALRLSAP